MSRFFHKHVDKGPDCWIWTAYRNDSGYGVSSRKCKLILAHREAWEDEYGPIPEGLQVLHKCDVRSCVRPDHLFLGDNDANVADRVKKNRSSHLAPIIPYHRRQRGIRHKLSKLNDNIIREMLSMYKQGVKICQIAQIYKVSSTTTFRIVHRKMWKHVAWS